MHPLFLLWILACASSCFPYSTFDSLQSAVKNALSRFGSDSLRIEYSFSASDLRLADNPKRSAWDPPPAKAWIYAPRHGFECRQVEDLKIIGRGYRGILIDSRTKRGNKTLINGWELVAAGPLHFSGFNLILTRNGDTAFAGGGGITGFGGSLGRITPEAIYFDGIETYAIAEPEYRDTLIYRVDSGKKKVCPRISSIAINLTNGFDYSGHMAPGKESRSRTIRCESLPNSCPLDTGEFVLREINAAIGDYGFTILNEDSSGIEAIFRTHVGCKRFADRWSKNQD